MQKNHSWLFVLPAGKDASPVQGYPSTKFARTHLYSLVERGTVKVKCLAQEHSMMSPARAGTWTAQSRDKRTNHEATAPLIFQRRTSIYTINFLQNKHLFVYFHFLNSGLWMFSSVMALEFTLV